MTVQLNSRTFDELTNCISELETLTSKPGSMSTREEKRHSFLLAKMAMLRQGVSVSELRNFEQDRILREIGYQLPAQSRTRLGEDLEHEWRNWLFKGECRSTNIPSEIETRYLGQFAGTQSILAPEGAKGGFFVPTDFAPRSWNCMRLYDELMSDWAATIIDTPTGSTFPIPSIDDTANAATILGESTQGTEVTVGSFSQKSLQAFKFHTGILALSTELETDSAFPWAAVLEELFSLRMARGVSKMLVSGNGVTQPTGLLTAVMASGATPVIAAGSNANDGIAGSNGTNSLGSSDLSSCLHKLDKAYRRNAIWAMSDDTLLFLDSIVSKQGLPLVKFRQGTTDEGPIPYILGRRVAVCPSLSDIGVSTNPVVLYAPEYFCVRRVPSSIYLQAFREAPGLAENGLLGLQMYGRYDSTLVATQNAARVPASWIQCHS